MPRRRPRRSAPSKRRPPPVGTSVPRVSPTFLAGLGMFVQGIAKIVEHVTSTPVVTCPECGRHVRKAFLCECGRCARCPHDPDHLHAVGSTGAKKEEPPPAP